MESEASTGIHAFARLREQRLRDVIGLELPSGQLAYDTVRWGLDYSAEPKVDYHRQGRTSP